MRTDHISNSGTELLSSRRLFNFIGFLMILSVICKLPVSSILNGWGLNGYGFTELLINFEGGFVRRGLLGEVLLWITVHTGIHPYITITTLCLVAFGFVLCFFLYVFGKKGYCRWIVFSPLLCGFVLCIIRKDYILYAITICMFLLLRHRDPALWKKLLAFALGLFGLMLHEAFVFFGIPLFALLLINDRRHRVINILILAALMSVFGILCVFKGDATVAQSIIDSWNSVLPGSPLRLIHDDSIGALTWETKETMIFHLKSNLGRSQLCLGVIFWPLLYFAAYYLITFFFWTFKPKKAVFGREEQTTLSSMFLIVTFCLLPMFTVLSCDYARLFQYAAITSFAAFFILDDSVRHQMIPEKVRSIIAKLNGSIARLMPPGKGTLILLLFIIGVSPASFNINSSLVESPIGGLWNGLWLAVYNIRNLILL